MAIQKTLNSEFLEKITNLLLVNEARLSKELSKIKSKDSAAFPEYGDKEDENAQEVAQFISDIPIEENIEKMHRDVKQALDRIKKGTYGVCKYCDKLIDEKRLLARPTSSACVSCKKTLTHEA